MIKIIGKEHCVNCEMTKKALGKKGIDFKYILLSELSKDESDGVMELAMKNNVSMLPFIIGENNKLLNLQEVLASVE